jgi:transcriptional regulator with XRE-family HTH domain
MAIVSELAVSPRMANAVDRLIGARMEARRIEIGMSLETLAESLRITPEQAQKFERGTARAPASTLMRVGQLLETSVSALLPTPDGALDADERAHTALCADILAASLELSPEGQTSLLATARALKEQFSAVPRKRV